MLRAIVKQGAIVPLEPLPGEWGEGLELSVEPRVLDATVETSDETDRIYDELDRMCAAGDPADFETLRAALQDVARHDKATVSRSLERIE